MAPEKARPRASREAPSDDAITAELRRRAAEGYEPDERIVECVTEDLAGGEGGPADLEDRVRQLAPEVFAARAAVERSWPVPTDCDRLDRAFAALERAGIVARQHFSCCQTCGSAEILDEIEAASAHGPVRGYTFFHVQDTESAVKGDGLCLAYGATVPEDTSEERWNRAAVAIGDEIVEALRAEGLHPVWSGEVSERIELPITWRRRRRR